MKRLDRLYQARDEKRAAIVECQTAIDKCEKERAAGTMSGEAFERLIATYREGVSENEEWVLMYTEMIDREEGRGDTRVMQ